MIQSVTIDGYTVLDMNDSTSVVNLTDPPMWLVGSPQPRDSTVPVPDDDGVLDLARYYEPRNGTLAGKIRASSWQQLSTIVDQIGRRVAAGAEHDLVFTLLDGSQRRCGVRALGAFEPQMISSGNPRATWSVDLVAPDPRVYSTTLRSATIAPTTNAPVGLTLPLAWPLTFNGATISNLLLITNAGRSSTRPTYQFTGPWTNPFFANLTTGVSFYTRGLNLGGGDVLVVDTSARTVSLNGALRLGFVDWSRSEYPLLASGQNQIRAGGGYSLGSSFGVSAYDAWI